MGQGASCMIGAPCFGQIERRASLGETKPTADRAAGAISTRTGVCGRTSVRNLMFPIAAQSRRGTTFAPIRVIGPIRRLVLRHPLKPLKVSAVGTQLSLQDSRTIASRLGGGVLRESQPLASVPAPARQAAVPTRTNDRPLIRKVCLAKGGAAAALPGAGGVWGGLSLAKPPGGG